MHDPGLDSGVTATQGQFADNLASKVKVRRLLTHRIYNAAFASFICSISSRPLFSLSLSFALFLAGAIAVTSGGGTGPIIRDGLQCTGNETSVSDCEHFDPGFRLFFCSNADDAGVVCMREYTSTVLYTFCAP